MEKAPPPYDLSHYTVEQIAAEMGTSVACAYKLIQRVHLLPDRMQGACKLYLAEEVAAAIQNRRRPGRPRRVPGTLIRPDGRKTCWRCRIEKLLAEFYKDKQSADGHQSCCIACRAKLSAEYQQAVFDSIGVWIWRHEQWAKFQGTVAEAIRLGLPVCEGKKPDLPPGD